MLDILNTENKFESSSYTEQSLDNTLSSIILVLVNIFWRKYLHLIRHQITFSHLVLISEVG